MQDFQFLFTTIIRSCRMLIKICDAIFVKVFSLPLFSPSRRCMLISSIVYVCSLMLPWLEPLVLVVYDWFFELVLCRG
jgi:hypothetical protein